jgi:drug/metabolite transporter (DMT)-like permease
MWGMVPFVLLIVYSLNLLYLVVWVNKTVQHCSYCADTDLPATKPEPLGLSWLILLVMLVHFFALTFWGFSENPYRGKEGPWIRPGDGLAMLVIFLIGFCLGALGFFLYRLGKLSGTLERRRIEIDEARRQKERDDFISLRGARP